MVKGSGHTVCVQVEGSGGKNASNSSVRLNKAILDQSKMHAKETKFRCSYKMTQILQLSDKDFKAGIITMFLGKGVEWRDRYSWQNRNYKKELSGNL